MPYFHEISDKLFTELQATGMTWQDLKEFYREPNWCRLGSQALDGGAGCWSLTLRYIRSVNNCAGCAECNTVFVTGVFKDSTHPMYGENYE